MSTLAFTRTGSGEPLLLIHGIGMSRSAWDPVLPALARRFDVVAVDLPGFGDSAPLPPQVEPTPKALAQAVAGFLEELGVPTAHVVGNSLGGWVAIELAAVRPVASLTLLSPAGLWRRDTPLYSRVSLEVSRWLSVHAGGVLDRLVGSPPGRGLVLGQTVGRPARMSPERARSMLAAMRTSAGFDAVFRATLRRRYRASAPITAPVTIAFGSRDRLLLARQSRSLDELPPDALVAELPGCGHVPMDDDPVAVAELITESAQRSTCSATPGACRTGP